MRAAAVPYFGKHLEFIPATTRGPKLSAGSHAPVILGQRSAVVNPWRRGEVYKRGAISQGV